MRFCFVAVFLLGLLRCAFAHGEFAGDARMLLDGVRAARLALREGAVEMRITQEVFLPPPEVRSWVVNAEWKNDSIRFFDTNPDGSFRRCTIRHDAELLFRKPDFGGGNHGGGVLNSDAGYGYIFFDPRILGAWPWLSAPRTAADLLFPADAKWACSVINDSDYVDGVECVVIRLETDTVVQDYWIAVDGFRVQRLVDYNNRYEFLSTYIEGGVLPRRVVWISRDRLERTSETIQFRTVFELSDVQSSPVPDGAFSIAGLGLEIGEPMIDLRVQERIGFWNGRGFSTSLNEALAVASTREPPARGTGRRLMLVLGTFVLVVAMLVMTLRSASQRANRGRSYQGS